jgi:hypothetical protein
MEIERVANGMLSMASAERTQKFSKWLAIERGLDSSVGVQQQLRAKVTHIALNTLFGRPSA